MSEIGLEIMQWLCYRRQGVAGVIALRRSESGFAIDWLLQDGPPTPTTLTCGYMAAVITTEAFGLGDGAARSARHRYDRLRRQMADFITGEGDAICPDDAKGADR